MAFPNALISSGKSQKMLRRLSPMVFFSFQRWSFFFHFSQEIVNLARQGLTKNFGELSSQPLANFFYHRAVIILRLACEHPTLVRRLFSWHASSSVHR